MYRQIGFIGVGNMGSALVRAVCKSVDPDSVLLCNRTEEKAKKLADELGCRVASCKAVSAACDLIFLAVKPQMMAGVLADMAPALRLRKDRVILVTLASGLTMETIQKMAGGGFPVIRIMPNTPVSIGAGVVQLCSAGTTEEELAAFCRIMEPAGLIDPLPESLMDAASAVSGCGPAFLYLFLEALADGGVACGLPRDKALRYAAQTMVGAGLLCLEGGEHPGLMKDRVCSPGGTTIQGVRALEKGGLRSAAFEAVVAAYEKTLEMKKGKQE